MDLVRFVVESDHITISVPARKWRERQPNQAVISVDARGRPVISDIGSTNADPMPSDARTLPIFSGDDFDPDLAMSAMRYWTVDAKARAAGRMRVLAWIDHHKIELTWSDWSRVPIDRRRRFLELAAHQGDVTVNGRLRASWSIGRRLLMLRPMIDP